MRRTLVLPLLSLLLLLGGCADQPSWTPPPAFDGAADATLDDRWKVYASGARQVALLPDCAPRRVEPVPGVPLRGTVLLLHGYSACPQQYFELAERLATRGYRSLIPLLPGHGRARRADGSDDVSGLPTGGTWRASFDAYAQALNTIMRSATGERILVGLSGGGATALHTALAAPALYDRLLVLSPFFDVAAPALVNVAIAVAGATPGLRALDATPFGSERKCLEKVAQGKASYCEWQLRHVRGMHALGQSVARRLLASPYTGGVQFVGVEGDKSVSAQRIRRVMLAHDGPGASACFYPAGVPHSMFSRFDHPGEDMYWLEDFHAAALAFIGEGRRFPTAGPSAVLAPVGRCRLERQESVGLERSSRASGMARPDRGF